MKSNKIAKIILISILMHGCKKNEASKIPAPTIYLADTKVEANGIGVPKYWKNSTAISVSDSNNESLVLSIFVNKEDVYMAGVQRNTSSFRYTAKYWKNGVLQAIPDNAQATELRGVVVQ